MNIDAIHRLNEFNKRYQPISSYHLNSESERKIIGEKIFSCIFCGLSKPEVSFKSKAHALPNFIGNNKLFTDRECDKCNAKFGKTLESHFAGFMHLDHTISGVKGKNGFLKFKSSDALIQTDGGSIDWKNVPPENITVDKIGGKIHIKQKIPTFVPIGVYKCLVKMAITIMLEDQLIHFKNTIKWLNEDDHAKTAFPLTELWFIYGASSTIDSHSGISSVLFRRTLQASKGLPFSIFQLTYANFVFMVPIPLSDMDEQTNWKEIPYCPTLLEMEYGYGRRQLQLLNFCQTDPLAGVEMTITATDLDDSGTYEEVTEP